MTRSYIFVMSCVLMSCTLPSDTLEGPINFASSKVIEDSNGQCFGRDLTPATIETVITKKLTSPAIMDTDGTVVREAEYKTVKSRSIVRERREVVIETVCPRDLTPDFISGVQRALRVRGFYNSAITGKMDATTKAALRSYQRSLGVESSLLHIQTAKDLGLIAEVPR